jgi:hypothetical protein
MSWFEELTGRLFFPCDIVFLLELIGLIVWGIRWLLWWRREKP